MFTLHFATIKGFHGFSGIVAGSIYTILAFIGFEASAPLAEEARNPRRTIGLAVLISCLVIGLFYVLTTYAGDVFYGPPKFVSFGNLGGGSPWIQLGRDAWGVGWVIVFIAIWNSTFANGNAGTLAATRTWFAMSRIGVLPAPLSRTSPGRSSPTVGVILQLVITLAIGLPIGLHFGPTTAFVFLATILTGIMIAIYMIFNLSCLMYYARRARPEFNWLLHGIIPVLGIVAFLPAWFTAMGIGGSVLKFVAPLPYPLSEAGLAIGIWYVIGVIALIYLYARHPARLGEMRRVFDEEAAVPAAQPDCHRGGRMTEEEGYLDVTGGRVWYRSVGDRGSATPLLCLHGGPGFTHYYLEALEALADRRQVIFYDQLGCGKPTGRTTCRCGRSTGSSRNSLRSGPRSASTTCTCSAVPGAACWPCSMCSTASRSCAA